MWKSAVGWVLVAVAALANLSPGLAAPEHLQQLKPLYLETMLAREGSAGAMLVPPASRDGERLARRLSAAVKERCGVELPWMLPSEAARQSGAGPNLVALGCLADNELIRRLYFEGYCWVDRWYPGPGGCVLQSIHNPWGGGRNVFLIGAGDARGLEAGVDAFCALLPAADGGALNLPRTFSVRLSDRFRGYREPGFAPHFAANQSGPANAYIFTDAERYLLTGDETYLQAYREAILKRAAGGRHDHFTYSFVPLRWDLIEEAPAFSDEERLQVTNYLLDSTRSPEGLAFSGLQRVVREGYPPQNHETRAALGSFFFARMVRRAYERPEADEWLSLLRRFWSPLDDCAKPMEDSTGHQYNATLTEAAAYALASDHRDFLTNGTLRRAADRAFMSCNNIGWNVPHGNAGWDGYPWHLLRMAACWYRDGRFRWMADNAPQFNGGAHESLRAFDEDTRPVPPTDHVGIRVAPLEKLFYQKHPYVSLRPPNIPRERSWDKISLRAGLKRDDQYVLLDGVGGGSHGYDDANSLVEYSANRRVYLAALDRNYYPNLSDHSAVTITRDGLGALPPSCAELVRAADLARVGFVQTALRDTNGADWTRTLVWVKTQALLAVDSVAARQAGDYSIHSRWRAIGSPTLTGDTFRVTQRPATPDAPDRRTTHFFILAADDAERSVRLEPNAFVSAYPYTDSSELAVLTSRTRKRLDVGQAVHFAALMYDTGADSRPARKAWAIAPGVVGLRADGRPAAAGLAPEGVPLGDYRVRAEAFYVSDSTAALMQGSGLSDRQGPLVSCVPPADIELDWEKGTGVARCDGPSRLSMRLPGNRGIRVNGRTPHPLERIPVGERSVLVTVALDAGTSALRFPAPWREPLKLPEPEKPASPPAPAATARALVPLWSSHLDGEVRDLQVGATLVAAGTDAGSAFVMEASGVSRLVHRTAGAIHGLAWGDLDGDGKAELLAGGDDCRVTAIRPEGAVTLWFYGIGFGAERWPPWELDRPSVRRLAAGDLDGDGKAEVVVGAGNMRRHLLDGTGRERWQRMAEHGIFATFTLADLDGDGKPEIVGGNDLRSSHSNCWVIGPGGDILKTLSNDGWASLLTALAVGDLTGDGAPEVVCATNWSNVYAWQVAPEQRRLWRANVGEKVSGVAILRQGDGGALVVASTQGGGVTAFGPDGAARWYRYIPAEVTRLAACRTPAGEQVALLCADGALRVLDARGEAVAEARLPAPPRCLAVGDLAGSGRDTLYVGCADGSVRAFTP